jgi:hypothetical protein
MSRPQARIPKRRPQGARSGPSGRRVGMKLRRPLIILVILLAAASIGAAVWLAGSRRGCEIGPGQVSATVQPTRLLEVPDYALETEITIVNSSPCELHLVVIKTKILNATLTDRSNYQIGVDDSQSIDLVVKPGGQTEVTYVFPQVDRRPTSLSVTITLGVEGQRDIPVFEGRIKVP